MQTNIVRAWVCVLNLDKIDVLVATESLQERLRLARLGFTKKYQMMGDNIWFQTSCIPSWQLDECNRDYALHLTQSNVPAELCVKVHLVHWAYIMVILQFRTKLAPMSNIGIKLISFMRPSHMVNNTLCSSTDWVTWSCATASSYI